MPRKSSKSPRLTPLPSISPEAAKLVGRPEPRPLEMYSCHVPDKSQIFYDRWAFAWRVGIEMGAPMRPELFWRMTDTLAPSYFEKHDWTHRVVNTLCSNRWVGVAGCSGSAKTHNIVGFACAWWLACPEESSVILCSTTSRALRKRGWSNVQLFYSSVAGARVGNMIDSQMLWQAEHGDAKHAIMGIAVEEGETTKVADNIKGVHTTRQMVIIDEATAVPHAIFEACTNLYTYPVDAGGEFILVMIGNPRKRFDEFGIFCEPDKGWASVSVEDDEDWETTPKLDGSKGICIRFDAEKSPNIISPGPGGALVSKHLPTKERVEARRRKAGFEHDPSYWSNERGFWAPEGLSKAVFTEAALLAGDAYGRHKFTGNNFKIIGALDPARTGGDRPALRFAALGEVEGGDWGIELMPPILIPLDARSTNPIDFQLVEQVRREAEHVRYHNVVTQCRPENLAVDATAGGADLVDIMQRMWSSQIIRIVFSAAASTEPVSHEDSRLCKDIFMNMRAEMYFRARHAVDSHQLKGIDAETAREICTIDFDDTKKLLKIVSKDDWRKRYGNSPDLSDTVAMIGCVARMRGFKLSILGQTIVRSEKFEQMSEKALAVYANPAHGEEEEEPPGMEMLVELMED